MEKGKGEKKESVLAADYAIDLTGKTACYGFLVGEVVNTANR